MGDPTDKQGNSADEPDISGATNDDEYESDIDMEAEEIGGSNQINTTTRETEMSQSSHSRSVPAQQQLSDPDTVRSILECINNPEAAVVIPVDDDIDSERMERFYSGALSAITKMRREAQKNVTKTETLRETVGPKNMEAWTKEHYEEIQNTTKPA